MDCTGQHRLAAGAHRITISRRGAIQDGPKVLDVPLHALDDDNIRFGVIDPVRQGTAAGRPVREVYDLAEVGRQVLFERRVE